LEVNDVKVGDDDSVLVQPLTEEGADVVSYLWTTGNQLFCGELRGDCLYALLQGWGNQPGVVLLANVLVQPSDTIGVEAVVECNGGVNRLQVTTSGSNRNLNLLRLHTHLLNTLGDRDSKIHTF